MLSTISTVFAHTRCISPSVCLLKSFMQASTSLLRGRRGRSRAAHRFRFAVKVRRKRCHRSPIQPLSFFARKGKKTAPLAQGSRERVQFASAARHYKNVPRPAAHLRFSCAGGALHTPKGVLHTPEGVLHVPKARFIPPKGCFIPPKGCFMCRRHA